MRVLTINLQMKNEQTGKERRKDKVMMKKGKGQNVTSYGKLSFLHHNYIGSPSEGQSDNTSEQYISPRTLTAKLGQTKHDTLLEQFQSNYTIFLYTQIWPAIQTLINGFQNL